MRRTLTILTIIIGIIAVIATVWWFVAHRTSEIPLDVTTTPDRTFNPFGLFSGDDTTTTTGTGTDTPLFPDVPMTVERPSLFKITEGPVAGVTTYATTNGTTTEHFVRYVERNSGNIYDYSLSTGREVRVSNTTIPRVHEALFGNSGATVVYRRLQDDGETVETYLGSISSATTTETRLSGSFLPENILTIALHPDDNRVFYTLRSGENGAIGYVVSGSATTNVFSHPFYQWQAHWSGNTVLLSTAPSYGVGGSAFTLNTNTGALARFATGPGLTVLPSGSVNTHLVGTANNNRLNLSTYSATTNAFTNLSMSALPEKCVWASGTTLYCAVPSNPATDMPDIWYQGAIALADTLWKIDTTSGITEYIVDPNRTISIGVDMIDLALSQDSNNLVFINKRDRSLWVADLALLTLENNQSNTVEGAF